METQTRQKMIEKNSNSFKDDSDQSHYKEVTATLQLNPDNVNLFARSLPFKKDKSNYQSTNLHSFCSPIPVEGVAERRAEVREPIDVLPD